MTDYTNIVPEGDDIVLEAASNGAPHPHDALVLDIDYRGDEPVVSLGVITVWTSTDGIPIEIWEGKIARHTLLTGACVVSREALLEALAEGGELSAAIDQDIANRDKPLDEYGLREDPIGEWLGGYRTRGAEMLVDESKSIWPVAEWCWEGTKDRVKPDTSDDDLAVYAKELEDAAKSDDVYLMGDVMEFLRDYRQHYAE